MIDIKIQILFVLSLLLINCETRNNNSKIDKIVEQWHERKIIFPDSLQLLQNNKLILLDSTFLKYTNSKIITRVSGECEMCVENIKRWFTFNNEIVLLGNPINNEKFKRLYIEKLNTK